MPRTSGSSRTNSTSRYVYISTAGIFDGEKDYYTDFDAPNPLGYYAKIQVYGESWVLRTVPRHFVFRAGWMMGGGPRKDKKFINKLNKQLERAQESSSSSTRQARHADLHGGFCAGIRRVVESDLYGLYNQVCKGSASRFEVAAALIEELGLAERGHPSELLTTSRPNTSPLDRRARSF